MSTELCREVSTVAVRRRGARIVRVPAVALAITMQLALVAWLLHPRETVRVEHTHSSSTTTRIVTVPLAVAIEQRVEIPAARATCPLPRRDAPFVAPAPTPERVERIKPSPTNAGWIAAWNDAQVFISTDAGASWHERLAREGTVRDVGFDCFGRVIVVRSSGVGVRDGDHETWRPVPGLALADSEHATTGIAAVLGGGPDLALVGVEPHSDAWRARLAISRDRGATWELRDLSAYWEGSTIAGRQHEDGSIVAMLPISDCGGDSPWVFRYRDGTVHGDYATIDAGLAIFGDRLVATDGWQSIDGDAHKLGAPPPEAGRLTVIAGPYPIFLGEDAAYRWRTGRFTRLPWKLPVEASGHIADPAGRIWSVVCGQPSVATRDEAPICDCDGP